MQTYLDGLRYLARRKVFPGPFNSQDWASVAPAIRQRAFFSSTINSARVLHRMRSMLLDWQSGAVETILTPSGATETAFKESGLAKFREKASELLISEGLATPSDFKNESIQNVISASRLKLIFNTNTAQAQDFAIYQSRVADPVRINRFPAAEFIRTPGAKVPRTLHVANEGAVRRYDDLAFWLAQNSADIGGFGVPWGPWGFNSFMTTFPVSRARAEKLGLVKPGEKIMPPDLTQFGVTIPSRFNKGVTADVDDITPEIKQQAINTIISRLGPQAVRPDGKLTLEALQALRGGGVLPPAVAPVSVPVVARTRSFDDVIKKLNKSITPEVEDIVFRYEKAANNKAQLHKEMLDHMINGRERERLEVRDKWHESIEQLNKLRPQYQIQVDKLRDAVSIPVSDRGDLKWTANSTDSSYWAANSSNLESGIKIIERYTSKSILVDVTVNRNNGREHASRSGIYVSAGTSPSVIAHEIAHVVEMRNKHVLQKSVDFLNKRAKGEKLRTLKSLTGRNYGRNEKAYKDDWEKLGGDAYSGKYYNDAATEILSMGIERLHADPLKFYRSDPEYFEFVVKTLQELP